MAVGKIATLFFSTYNIHTGRQIERYCMYTIGESATSAAEISYQCIYPVETWFFRFVNKRRFCIFSLYTWSLVFMIRIGSHFWMSLWKSCFPSFFFRRILMVRNKFYVWKSKTRERERERERQTDRDREGERQRHRERETDRQRIRHFEQQKKHYFYCKLPRYLSPSKTDFKKVYKFKDLHY